MSYVLYITAMICWTVLAIVLMNKIEGGKK